ncbi:MAG: nitrite/sulfite reductase [Candidatus Auribacter fodinae]|jgi:sulfite reductase beta subunit-like hemoprotein|uniref:Nitrite/sulfite reductase n=1 Tax=Candidatus Auribacter fodinae TaxID=2093366 RepID=A0A3A4QVC6_9BACT|nr:MAG: nitrite/sulfite reductase [Candidatus Auribacter fodinae]
MPQKPDLTQIEIDKLTIDPNIDFREIAERPFEKISKNELGMFKFSGVYHQLQTGFFMIRLRLPGGLMTSEQLEKAAELSDLYAQSQLCITTRQTLQYHWIRQQDIYKVMDAMKEVGIITTNACGDVTRNVVACELQGVCPHEVCDTRSKLLEIADDEELLHIQRNLPRKHKISVAGCGRACGQTLMNCQGWYPVVRTVNGREEIGWRFHAGGGLGGLPRMGRLIFDWVPDNLVLEVARASTEAFRRLGDRRNRKYARLKIVIDRLGAGDYGNAVLEIMKDRGIKGIEKIEKASGLKPDVGYYFVDGQPYIEQKQKGFFSVRAMIKRSELSADESRQFAAWARIYGNGEIMFTARQNLHIRHVPEAKVEALRTEMKKAGFRVDGFERIPDAVSCVGTTVCNLAVSDTPKTYHEIVRNFADDKEFWDKIGHLCINMNGCPNSCGQHWIVDIGLRGRRIRKSVGSEEGFTVHVGGALTGEGSISQPVFDVRSTDVVPALKSMLELYLAERNANTETFYSYVHRIGFEELQKKLTAIIPGTEPVNVRNQELKSVFQQIVDEA